LSPLQHTRNITFFVLLLSAATAALSGGDFGVVPLRLDVSQDVKATTVQITNNGTEPVVIQTQTVTWTQPDGIDKYVVTEDILASPPIVKIPGKSKQIVRVGLLRKPDSKRELTYRLFLEEVPQPNQQETGVGFALRIGLPVFVAPLSKKAVPLVEWLVTQGEAGKLLVTGKNIGTAHARGPKVKVLSSSGDTVLDKQLDGYLLSGETRTWEEQAAKTWNGELKVSSGTAAVTPSSDQQAVTSK
jgi:fimbrial chaperone protein